MARLSILCLMTAILLSAFAKNPPSANQVNPNQSNDEDDENELWSNDDGDNGGNAAAFFETDVEIDSQLTDCPDDISLGNSLKTYNDALSDFDLKSSCKVNGGGLCRFSTITIECSSATNRKRRAAPPVTTTTTTGPSTTTRASTTTPVATITTTGASTTTHVTQTSTTGLSTTTRASTTTPVTQTTTTGLSTTTRASTTTPVTQTTTTGPTTTTHAPSTTSLVGRKRRAAPPASTTTSKPTTTTKAASTTAISGRKRRAAPPASTTTSKPTTTTKAASTTAVAGRKRRLAPVTTTKATTTTTAKAGFVLTISIPIITTNSQTGEGVAAELEEYLSSLSLPCNGNDCSDKTDSTTSLIDRYSGVFSDNCLTCIGEVDAGSQSSGQLCRSCSSDSGVCGIYNISQSYFKVCANQGNDFKQCTTGSKDGNCAGPQGGVSCSTRCVQKYVQQFTESCLLKAQQLRPPMCADYAAVHHAGAQGCGSASTLLYKSRIEVCCKNIGGC